MKRIVVASRVYRLVEAQDPLEEEVAPPEGDVPEDTGSEMVEELREGPAAKWEKYQQPIMVSIRNRFGLNVGQVKLIGPKIKNTLTSPAYGFAIVGHVKFLPGPPPEVREQHGLPPYKFEAFVTPDGKLVSSVRIVGSEG